MKINLGDFQCVYDRVGRGPDLTLLHSVGLSTRRLALPDTCSRRALSGSVVRLSGARAVRTRIATDQHCDVRSGFGLLLTELDIPRPLRHGNFTRRFVAQAFALERPERLSALVLVSATCGHLAVDGPSRNARIAQVLKFLGMAAAAGPQLEKQFAPDSRRPIRTSCSGTGGTTWPTIPMSMPTFSGGLGDGIAFATGCTLSSVRHRLLVAASFGALSPAVRRSIVRPSCTALSPVRTSRSFRAPSTIRRSITQMFSTRWSLIF